MSEIEWANRFQYRTVPEPLDWGSLGSVALKRIDVATLQAVVRTIAFGSISLEDLRGRTLGEVHHTMHVMQIALQYVLHGQQFLLQCYEGNKTQFHTHQQKEDKKVSKGTQLVKKRFFLRVLRNFLEFGHEGSGLWMRKPPKQKPKTQGGVWDESWY